MNLPNIRVNLPTPDTHVDGRDALRMGVDLLFNRRSPRELAMQLGARALMQGIDEATGGLAGEAASYAAQLLEEAQREWTQDWLPTLKFALIAVQGDPGEGKTTLVAYLLDKYLYHKRIYWIGVPGELLPPGHKELSSFKLAELGVAIDKAAKNHQDPKELIAKFLGTDWALAVDDAGAYLAAGSSQKPENIAVRNIIDLRRHLNGVVIVNFQSFFGVDQKFTKADCYLLKQAAPEAAGGDRPEILRMRKDASLYFDALNGILRGQGFDRRELKARRVLKAWCVCPEVELRGPITHGRPSWFGEAFSRNAAHSVADIDDDPNVVDAEFNTQEDA
jgi:hypothetical protein